MPSPLTLALFVAVLCVGAVWVAVLVARPPVWLTEPSVWGAIAFATVIGQALVVPLFAHRAETQLGVQRDLGPGLSAVSALMTGIVVGTSLMAVVTSHRRLGPGARWIVGSLWAIAGVTVLSAAVAAEPMAAKWSLILAALVHATAVSAPDRRTLLRWLRVVLRSVVLGSLVLTIIAPSWAFIGADADGNFDRTLGGVARLSGLTSHPGTLAVIATLALLVEFACLRTTGALGRVALAGAAVCVLLAQSRTLWAAACLGLVLMSARRWPSLRRSAYAVLALAAVVLAFRPSIVVGADWTFGSQNVQSVSGRTIIWQYATAAFESSPWIGVGPGFLGEDYRRAFLPADLQYVVHAHNQVMQTLAETGIVGLAALGVLVGAMVVVAWRIRRADASLGAAMVVVLLMTGVAGVPLRAVGEMVIPALVVLSYLCVARREGPAGDPFVPTPATTQRPDLQLAGS